MSNPRKTPYTCPECGHEDGIYFFTPYQIEEGGRIVTKLVCPKCSAVITQEG